jgi:hypothetical protein
MKKGKQKVDLGGRKRLPEWMRMRMPGGDQYMQVKEQVNKHGASHHLLQRQLSQHRGVLGGRNGHFHDPGGTMHPGLQILCGENR